LTNVIRIFAYKDGRECEGVYVHATLAICYMSSFSNGQCDAL